MQAMSRRLSLAPFAITSEGDLVLNVAKLSSTTKLEEVLRRAMEERGALYIGVILSRDETELVLGRLENAGEEAAAKIVGQRPVRPSPRRG